MFRKNLIPLLLDRSLTLSQLARLTGEKPRLLADHLNHLWRSLKHTDYRPEIFPARCRRCEFEFGPEKLMKPSRCPKCRGTWIAEAQVGVRFARAE